MATKSKSQSTRVDSEPVKGEVLPAVVVPSAKDVAAVDVEKVLRSRKDLTSAEAAALVHAAELTAVTLDRIMNRLYQGRAWLVTLDSDGKPYTNFGTYCREVFGVSKSKAYRHLRSANFAREAEDTHALAAPKVATLTSKQGELLDQIRESAERAESKDVTPAQAEAAKRDLALLKSIVRKVDQGEDWPSVEAIREMRKTRSKRAKERKMDAPGKLFQSVTDYVTGGQDGAKALRTEPLDPAAIVAWIAEEYDGNPDGLREAAQSIMAAAKTLAGIAKAVHESAPEPTEPEPEPATAEPEPEPEPEPQPAPKARKASGKRARNRRKAERVSA